MAPRLLDRKTAAAYCGVSANTFAAYVEPHVPAFDGFGKRRLFDVRMIDAWIDRKAPERHTPGSLKDLTEKR